MSEDDDRPTNDEIRAERRDALITHAMNLLRADDTAQFVVIAFQDSQIRVSVMADYMFLSAAGVRCMDMANRQMACGNLEFKLPTGPLS